MSELPDYAPSFSLTAEGQDITRTVQECLQSLTLTDYGGNTAKSDELKITLISQTLPLPPKGARLRLGLGFNGRLIDKGWFVVSGVGSGGPPRRVEIYATAAPMNAQKKAGDVQSHKSRSWDDITLEELVKTVAENNGLKARVAEPLKSIKITHIDQISESDANFMTRIARTYNAVSKPAGGYWLLLEQGAGQTVSGKEIAAVTMTPADVSTWSYSEGQRGSTSGKAESGKKGKVSVNYYDEADGKTKTATVDHDGPDIENPFTQPSQDIAKSKAAGRQMKSNRNEKKMTLNGPCRESNIRLTAEARIITQGFGTREDHTWLIESLERSLTAQGLSYTLNLVVDVKTAKGKKGKDKKTGPDYF